MDFLYLCSIFGGVSTLVFLPLLCLMDIKTRQIPDKVIIAYALINAIPLAILYIEGLPIFYAATSLCMALVYLGFRQLKIYGGADAKFLMVQALAVPFNPLNLNMHMYYQIIVLLAIGIALGITTVLYYRNRTDVPMLVPISIGILGAMVAGMFV